MKNFADLTNDQQADVMQGVGSAVPSLILLGAVIRNARRGRWERALVYSVLWVGQGANTNALAAERKAAQRHKQMHDCQHEMNKVFASAAARRSPAGRTPAAVSTDLGDYAS